MKNPRAWAESLGYDLEITRNLLEANIKMDLSRTLIGNLIAHLQR